MIKFKDTQEKQYSFNKAQKVVYVDEIQQKISNTRNTQEFWKKINILQPDNIQTANEYQPRYLENDANRILSKNRL